MLRGAERVPGGGVPFVLLLLPSPPPRSGDPAVAVRTLTSFLSSSFPFSLSNEISAEPNAGPPSRVSHQINCKEINTVIRAFSALIRNLTRPPAPAPLRIPVSPWAPRSPASPTPSRSHAPRSFFVTVGPAPLVSPGFVSSFVPTRCDFDEASEPLRPFLPRRPGAAVEVPRPGASRRSRRLCALY